MPRLQRPRFGSGKTPLPPMPLKPDYSGILPANNANLREWRRGFSGYGFPLISFFALFRVFRGHLNWSFSP